MAASEPPRRFKVEPIEITVKSSKYGAPEESKAPKRPRRFAPEPVETSTKTNRRTTSDVTHTNDRSSKDCSHGVTEETKRPRKFAPEPIETTRKSRKKFAEEWDNETKSPTSERKARRPRRKFVPQLIETAQRSRRAGDTAPTIRPADKTEAMPVEGPASHIRLKTLDLGVPSPPDNTPTFDYSHNPLFLEIQRATSPLSRRRPISRASHHSFRVPDLEPIESSESEGSSPPSPSTSPSIISDRSCLYKEATRMRESVDERFSGYLLELAAKAAEKQLREQAMAAFPNDDYHEPVDHFVDRDYDMEPEVSRTKSRHDRSFDEVNWELVAMRKHREKLEQQQETEREQKRQHDAELNREGPQQSPWGNPAAFIEPSAKDVIGGYQNDGELDRMRKVARPPMLGADVKFARCRSPEPARFDTTQGCDVVRKAMCYLTEQSLAAEKGEGLWCGNGSGKHPNKVPSLWSNGSSRSPSRNGLWAGCCVDLGNSSPKGPTGILTPRTDKENPLETPCPTPAMSLLPPTPPASNTDFACIDEKLAAELTIEEEFGDDFVTQVYNYLSLGYPSMARSFDEELSKISRISVAELRQDDHLAQSRGYIRLGADGNLTSAELTEESCMRWRALRVYIREWAKQHPGMAGESMAGGMETAVRRGSWAI